MKHRLGYKAWNHIRYSEYPRSHLFKRRDQTRYSVKAKWKKHGKR